MVTRNYLLLLIQCLNSPLSSSKAYALGSAVAQAMLSALAHFFPN